MTTRSATNLTLLLCHHTGSSHSRHRYIASKLRMKEKCKKSIRKKWRIKLHTINKEKHDAR